MEKEILTPCQQKALRILPKEKDFRDHFYFTGGTALAHFYLRHRYSEDLDFFSEEEIDLLWLNNLRRKIKTRLGADKAELQQSFNRNLLFFSFKDKILKTEFTYFPFKQIEPPKTIAGLKVDSLLDIAVNKFFTIYQKPGARHFIDLYLIIESRKVAWEELFNFARIKFDTVIDPLQLGRQLVSVEEAGDLPKMIKKIASAKWQTFFLQKAQELKRQL